jgi:DNA gyrase/topoisomerase IV subunit B
MKLQPEDIIEETEREAIINRPHNLAGSVQPVFKERFSIKPDKVEYQETNIVPAVLKLFQESLDNPIDVAIKSGYNFANKISITVDKKSIRVSDNGYGISSKQDAEGVYPLYKAMCRYNTSSNYRVQNEGQKGVNGIGIKLCTTLSTLFEAVSDDGEKRIKVKATDNNLNHEVFELKTKEKGTEIYFEPDFKIFELNEIDEAHINRMFEYTLIQALTYPEIDFKFNGKSVKYTPKKFLSLFEKESVLHESDNYFLAIMNNETDDFKQVSFINGLETSRGGSHINYVVNGIVSEIRAKLIKKYPLIKPADIKNKLQLVMVARNFKGLKWDGQTKESVTNPDKDMSAFFNDLDFKKIADRILKTPSIIENITEVYKIKEELKKRQELKSLEKPTKKIRSEKYLPAIGEKKYLLIVEGDSACGGLVPVLGRQIFGYYTLKGKPLNVWSAKQSEFTDNEELSDLYRIILNEGYEYIVVATDQDLDGLHIRTLLSGFMKKYLDSHLDRYCMMQTPVLATKKGNQITGWYYDADARVQLKSGETMKYYKGLGSWTEKDLKYIVEQDGIENMIMQVDFDDVELLDDWLNKSKDKIEVRKKYIDANFFNIALL